MSKHKHTATPWFLDEYMNVWANCHSPWIGGTSICKINRDEDRTTPTERDANAEFIVKACNNHDALLAACKTLLAICRWKCSPLDDVVLTDGRTNEQAMIEAMEVIQRVDGEPNRRQTGHHHAGAAAS